MATTYSNPKEMLGYLVVKFMEQQMPLLQAVPYDKRAVHAYYYQLKAMDVHLTPFKKDMFLFSDSGEKIGYFDCMKEISTRIREEWNNVHAKDHDRFMDALYKWSELIASCYPKLGLVPETGVRIDRSEYVQDSSDEEDSLSDSGGDNSVEDISRESIVGSKKVGGDSGGSESGSTVAFDPNKGREKYRLL